MIATQGRLLVACTLFVGLMARELAQRPGPAAAAQAHIPVGMVQAHNLQPVARGSIPMPANTPSAHASNLVAMPAGSSAVLSAFWFAGERESAPDVQIAASQFDRASGQWLPARFVVNRHAMAEALGFGVRRLGNPVAWVDASGRLHLFVVATGLGGWAAGRILHLVQSSAGNDLGQLAFQPVRVLPLSWLWNTSYLVRSAPLPLQDGGMVLPAYFEMGYKRAVALRFDAQGHFVGMVRMSQRNFLLQPALIAQTPSNWFALLRASKSSAHIAVLQTQNGGKQWSDLPDLPQVNPDAAVAALTLAQGQHVLVHNSSPHSRALLDMSVSGDGVSWSPLYPLAHGTDADEYSYPALAWADGNLWVSYTDHRTHIVWQRFAPRPNPATAP